MARTTYWLCFALVLISILISTPGWLFYLTGTGFTLQTSYFFIFSFGSIVPVMLSPLVPHLVHMALGVFLMGLLLRRLWLLFSKKESVPPSFTGIAKVLGYIGAGSFMLSAATLALTIALHAGSGVPGGLFLLPAVICIPWSIFITEVRSLRRSLNEVAAP